MTRLAVQPSAAKSLLLNIDVWFQQSWALLLPQLKEVLSKTLSVFISTQYIFHFIGWARPRR